MPPPTLFMTAGCRLLRAMAAVEDMRPSCAQRGVVLAVVAAMRSYPEDVDVATFAVGILDSVIFELHSLDPPGVPGPALLVNHDVAKHAA